MCIHAQYVLTNLFAQVLCSSLVLPSSNFSATLQVFVHVDTCEAGTDQSVCAGGVQPLACGVRLRHVPA